MPCHPQIQAKQSHRDRRSTADCANSTMSVVDYHGTLSDNLRLLCKNGIEPSSNVSYPDPNRLDNKNLL